MFPRLFRSTSEPSLREKSNNTDLSLQLQHHLNPMKVNFFGGRNINSHPPAKDKPIILIDWDGCLCDSMPRILKRVEMVGKELKKRHPQEFRVSDEKLKTPWVREYNDHLQFVFGEFYQEAADLDREYINHKDLPPKQAYEYSREFIETIKKANIQFAIVSNSSRSRVKDGINEFGWQTLLENVPIICSDDVKPRVKPDPYHFTSALNQLGVNIKNLDEREIIIIGDGAESDMLGALKLSEQGFNVKAIWINHSKQIDCELTTKNNFLAVKESVLEFIHGNKESKIAYII